eukprot:944763_1
MWPFLHPYYLLLKKKNLIPMKRSPTIRYGLSEMEDHIDAHAYAQPMFHTTHTSDDIHPDSMVDDNENTYGVMSSYHKYHEAPSSMSMNKPSAIDTTRVSFEKMDVGYVQTLSPALSKHKSGLSFIIGGDSDAKEDNGLAQQLMLRRSPTVRHGLAQFGAGYPSTNLQSHLASDYDNDIDDLYELDPPLTRNAKICEFVDQNRSYITAHKAMCYVQRTKHKSSNLELILNGDNHRRNTMNTLNELAQKQDKYKQNVFIRVYIAGPTTETSVLLNIDSVASRTVRDLFTILNRKRTRDRFNAQYFDFYYKNKTKELGAIANGVSVMDLVQNDLIVLPKILSSDMNANTKEAFQFLLVRLANEAKQYKAWKIDKYRTKKKAFVLEVDRYRLVKTAEKNKVKMPIAIQDIQRVVATEKSNGHHLHHNQFTITYYTADRSKKIKTFEMSSTQIRDELVDKLNFLCIIRRLQG